MNAPLKIYGYEVEQEIERESESAGVSRYELFLEERVRFWSRRYVQCCRQAQALEARCSELELRPPLNAPFWRRLWYLMTGN